MRRELDPEGIEVVFFDVGNTLLKPHPSLEAICRHVIEQFGYRATDEELRRGIRAADEYYEYRYWNDDSFWSSEKEAAEMWAEMYALMLEEIGVDGDRRLIGRAIYDYFGHGDRWRTYPDVVPVFEKLIEAGYRLGLISNWDSRLTKLCFDMGLERYLEAVVSSATVGLIKPDPHIFEVACRRMAVEPHEAVHVGDHYYADVMGARSAGIFPVMIDRYSMGHETDCPVIEDLLQLLPLFNLED